MCLGSDVAVAFSWIFHTIVCSIIVFMSMVLQIPYCSQYSDIELTISSYYEVFERGR